MALPRHPLWRLFPIRKHTLDWQQGSGYQPV